VHHGHVIAASHQVCGDPAPDEPRAAQDEDSHAATVWPRLESGKMLPLIAEHAGGCLCAEAIAG
jgi:hypothetical protein